MHKLIFIMLVFFISSNVYSQSLREADSVTYSLYLNRNWEELISYSEKTINTGTDFYYLRIRTGIAEYELKDYMSAIPNFKKCLEFAPGDELAAEYLYYCNLFIGRSYEARKYARLISSKQRNDLKIKTDGKFPNVYSEAGYTNNLNYDDLRNNFNNDTLIYDEAKFLKEQTYFNFTFGLNITNSLSANIAYNNIGITSLTKIAEPIGGEVEFQNKTDLNEFYIASNFSLGNSYTVTPAYHYSGGNAEYIQFSYVQGQQGLSAEYTQLSTKIQDHVFFLAVNKYFSKFNFNLSGSYSDISSTPVYQGNFITTFFPKGNLDLYFIAKISYLDFKNNSDDGRVLFEPKAGIKIFDKLWGEIFYTAGNISYYNETNAFIVYNNLEKIDNRFGLNLISPIIPDKLTASLRFQMYDQYSYDLRYTDFTNFILSENKNKLIKLIGGLQWNL